MSRPSLIPGRRAATPDGVAFTQSSPELFHFRHEFTAVVGRSCRRAVAAIRQTGQIISDETLAHLTPLQWEQIKPTGDYHWRKDAAL